MRTDQWGRQYLDGNEGCPNDLICFKCGVVPYKRGNPYGVHIMTFSRADVPEGMSGFALCDPCSVALWEYLTPGLLKQGSWIAAKDQHQAAIPSYQEHWNERAQNDAHRTWGDGCTEA